MSDICGIVTRSLSPLQLQGDALFLILSPGSASLHPGLRAISPLRAKNGTRRECHSGEEIVPKFPSNTRHPTGSSTTCDKCQRHSGQSWLIISNVLSSAAETTIATFETKSSFSKILAIALPKPFYTNNQLVGRLSNSAAAAMVQAVEKVAQSRA
jgi:hypothetical protein